MSITYLEYTREAQARTRATPQLNADQGFLSPVENRGSGFLASRWIVAEMRTGQPAPIAFDYQQKGPSMRYVLKQKFWAFGDDFGIRDAEGQQVFFVDGRAFSWGDKLSFQDMQRNELAFIRQKLLAWGPTYEIEREGRLIAVVKKKLFTLLRCRFTIDVPGPDDLEARGSFLDHEYTFERHGQEVAQVSKKWFSWTDTYGVDVNAAEDAIVILASAIVIDMVCHQESKR